MAVNIGTFDRIIRTIAGMVLLALAGLSLSGVWQILAGILGLVMLVTAVTRVCPAYRLIGLRTCRSQCPPLTPKEDQS